MAPFKHGRIVLAAHSDACEAQISGAVTTMPASYIGGTLQCTQNKAPEKQNRQ